VLSHWIARYLEDCYALAQGTRNLYAYHLQCFLDQVGDGDVAGQTRVDTLRHFLATLRRQDGQPYSPHYVDQVYRTLNTFLEWCIREGAIEHNPLRRIRRPRVPRTISPRLTLEEIDRLIEAIKHGSNPARDLAMICLAVDSGLRRNEIRTLELDHVDLQGQVVRVIGKGDKEREVPIDTFTCHALRVYLSLRPRVATKKVFLTRRGRPFTVNGIQTLIYRLKTRANLPQLRWHLLRHTFANLWLANGGGLRYLQEVLGHADIKITAAIYTNPELDELKAAHGRAAPLANRKTPGEEDEG